MKLRVIAKNSQMKDANLHLKKENKFYLHNQEFEVEDERGKELLNTKWEGNPIVEEVKEVPKARNKANTETENIENKED